MIQQIRDLTTTINLNRRARVKCIVGNNLPPNTTYLSVNGKSILQDIKLVTLLIDGKSFTGLGFETEIDVKGFTHLSVVSSGGSYDQRRAMEVLEL